MFISRFTSITIHHLSLFLDDFTAIITFGDEGALQEEECFARYSELKADLEKVHANLELDKLKEIGYQEQLFSPEHSADFLELVDELKTYLYVVLVHMPLAIKFKENDIKFNQITFDGKEMQIIEGYFDKLRHICNQLEPFEKEG